MFAFSCSLTCVMHTHVFLYVRACVLCLRVRIYEYFKCVGFYHHKKYGDKSFVIKYNAYKIKKYKKTVQLRVRFSFTIKIMFEKPTRTTERVTAKRFFSSFGFSFNSSRYLFGDFSVGPACRVLNVLQASCSTTYDKTNPRPRDKRVHLFTRTIDIHTLCSFNSRPFATIVHLLLLFLLLLHCIYFLLF